MSEALPIALGAAALPALAAVAHGAGVGRPLLRRLRPGLRSALVAGRPQERWGAAGLLAVAAVTVGAGRPLSAVALAAPGLVIAALLEARPLALEARRRGPNVRATLLVVAMAGVAAVLVVAGARGGSDAARAAGAVALAACAVGGALLARAGAARLTFKPTPAALSRARRGRRLTALAAAALVPAAVALGAGGAPDAAALPAIAALVALSTLRGRAGLLLGFVALPPLTAAALAAGVAALTH